MSQNQKIFYSFLLQDARSASRTIDRWSAEVKIYREMKNPKWNITQRAGKKLLKLASVLPAYDKGIPGLTSGSKFKCILFLGDDVSLTAADGFVIVHRGNIIELKTDADRRIENAILRSAPIKLFMEMRHYL
jgi:hypothetical protein